MTASHLPRALGCLLLLLAAGSAQDPLLPSSPWADEALADALERELGIRGRATPLEVFPRRGEAPPAERRGSDSGEASTWSLAAVMVLAGTLVLTVVALLVAAHLWRTRRAGIRRGDVRSVAADLREAERRLAAGDHTAAIGLAYRCGVRAVERDAPLPGAKAMADGAILRAMGDGGAAPLFAGLAAVFQPVRYGGRPGARNDAERCVGLARSLLETLAAPERAR